MAAPLDFFGPFEPENDIRTDEMRLKCQKLSLEILEIFGGDMKKAEVFVKRTLQQMRCIFGPCFWCGSFCKRNLICIRCQRAKVFGAEDALPKESKQNSYFVQFKIELTKRATQHKERCVYAGKVKITQAVARGWLTRNSLR